MDENLSKLSKKELLAVAKEKGLKGVSAWTKEQLVSRLQQLAQPLRRKSARGEAEPGKIAAGTLKAAVSAEEGPAGRPPKAASVSRNGTASLNGTAKAETAAAQVAEPEPPAEKTSARVDATPGSAALKVNKKAAKPARSARTVAKVVPAAADPAGDSPRNPDPSGSGSKKDAAKSSPAKAKAKAEVPEASLQAEPSGDDTAAVTETAFKAAEAAQDAPAEPGKPAFKKTTKIDELLSVDEGLGELPMGYDEDRAVLLVRDPYWVYAYWDLSYATTQAARERGDYRLLLRVQELGGFDRTEPSAFYDVAVPKVARSWYLRLPADGRRYRVEVALQHRDGTYSKVAQTNIVDVPRGEPSDVVADRFVTLPGDEDEILDRPRSTLPPVAEWEAVVTPLTSAGPAPTPPFPARPLGARRPTFGPRLAGPWSGEMPWGQMPWAMRPEAQAPGGPLPLGVAGSSGVGSQSVGSWSLGASENRPGARKKDFWLIADAELIVYGATEPDARVTLRGERVDLRPDGTFSFRFYLPDGMHPLPIRAINADGDDERRITITVERNTTGDPRVNVINQDADTSSGPRL